MMSKVKVIAGIAVGILFFALILACALRSLKNVQNITFL